MLVCFEERMIDRFLNIAEKRMDRAADHFTRTETRYLRRRGIKSEDLSVKVRRDQAGADRFDDAFMKEAKISKALGCFLKLFAGKSALRQSCSKKSHYKERNNVETDDLNYLGRRRCYRIEDPP